MKRDYLLSPGARAWLSELGARLALGPAPDNAGLDGVLADLELQPAEAVSRLAGEISHELGGAGIAPRRGSPAGSWICSARDPRRRRNLT